MDRMREVLEELGYAPAPGRENYQYVDRERAERGASRRRASGHPSIPAPDGSA